MSRRLRSDCKHRGYESSLHFVVVLLELCIYLLIFFVYCYLEAYFHKLSSRMGI